MLAASMTSAPAPPRAPRLVQQEAVALHPVVRAVVAAVLREAPAHPDVEDCTNEALRRALEGQDRLRDGEPLRPWVVGIARHVALDVLRAKKRRRMEQTTAPDSSGDLTSALDRVPDSKPSPFERVASARRDDHVRRAIAELPESTRVALTKFHLEGKSYQQIAEEMKVPLGTVATWVTRGRKAIAQRISEES